MKKFALMLLALLLCASATAEERGADRRFSDPAEGFAPIAEAEEQGYRGGRRAPTPARATRAKCCWRGAGRRPSPLTQATTRTRERA